MTEKKMDLSCKQLQIPLDLLMEILTRLPANSLMRFKCICKLWYSLIRNPRFVKLHQTRSLTRPEGNHLILILVQNTQLYIFSAKNHAITSLTLPRKSDNGKDWHDASGSLNGLICLYNSTDTYVINLSTHEILSLPETETPSNSRNTFCLGFNPLTEEYKVLHTFYNNRSDLERDFQVGYEIITLGNNSWRRISNPHLNSFGFQKSINVNGVIYFRVYKDRDALIMAFDVSDEKFRIANLPAVISSPYYDVCEIGGRLGMLRNECYGQKNKITLWILEDYKNQIWIREDIEFQSNNLKGPQLPCYFLGTSYNGELILASDKFCVPKGIVYYYDIKNKTRRRIKIKQQMKGNGVHVIHHVENISPLKGCAFLDLN